jgi:hypothetical protein
MCPVHYIFRFSYFGQNDQKQKNQLKVTADFFVFDPFDQNMKNEKCNEPDMCDKFGTL